MQWNAQYVTSKIALEFLPFQEENGKKSSRSGAAVSRKQAQVPHDFLQKKKFYCFYRQGFLRWFENFTSTDS